MLLLRPAGNATEDAKYFFKYPTGWKTDVINKTQKGTQVRGSARRSMNTPGIPRVVHGSRRRWPSIAGHRQLVDVIQPARLGWGWSWTGWI